MRSEPSGVAKRVTADADMKLDDRGRKIKEPAEETDYGDNVIIVDPTSHAAAIKRTPAATATAEGE